jgi:hypothetical protein
MHSIFWTGDDMPVNNPGLAQLAIRLRVFVNLGID